jgi:cbb3-type cytochrome oxidase subunit 1
MKLVEVIVSIALASLFVPIFADTMQPIMRLRGQTALLKEELRANYFISESFYALSSYGVDFEKWQNTVRAVTGCVVTITMKQKTQTAHIYRAEWNYKNKTLFVESAFNLNAIEGGSHVH